ncbi:hypothetical protein VTO42DRAFT_823 [Malbranchea cinnamomea]
MRWRKSFLSFHSTAPGTAPRILALLFLTFCSPVQVDHTESQLLDTVCAARDTSDIQSGYIRYPVCLETRWVVGAPPASQATWDAEAALKYTSEEQRERIPTSTVSVSATETPQQMGPDADADSPLDNVNFLSFEEWKKQNLAKVGQSAENVRGNRHVPVAEKRKRLQTQGINNALDGLGDEGEIELEFGGFGADKENIRTWELREGKEGAVSASSNGTPAEEHVAPGTEGEVPPDGVARRGAAWRRDAGTTCKERFNYASFDCAATVLKTNPQCTGSSAVLNENKDSYMLNECRAKDKFLILELCDDILVDTIVLANFEFFSSIFRTFRVSVSDRYPAKQWRELGTYQAANTREVQAFAVENPLIWARYLKIEFLTHYGNEFYCPVSLIRVHGTTMMEEYKNEGDAARAEADEEVAAIAEANVVTPSVDAKVEAQEVNQGDRKHTEQNNTASVDAVSNTHKSSVATLPNSDGAPICVKEQAYVVNLLLGSTLDMCAISQSEHETVISLQLESIERTEDVDTMATITANAAISKTVALPDTVASNCAESETLTQSPSQEVRISTSTESSKLESDTPTEIRPPTTTTQQPPPPPPNPTTQESFFKSVHKRLQMLETNSSLSLLYIEEQSRILRDAFNKVEKRQLAKTTNFLENLNNTVHNELREFRQQYDHIWHFVVYEFEQQRQQYNRELFAVSAQLGVLADELVFQKRISIIQSIFVLICFGLVLFSRSAVGSYLELPRVPSFVSRSHSFMSASPASPSYNTPSASPSPSQRPHTHSSYSKSMAHHHHKRTQSENSRPEGDNASSSEPILTYSGPTPPVSERETPRSERDESIVMTSYQQSETSSSSASNNALLMPESGQELWQRNISEDAARVCPSQS